MISQHIRSVSSKQDIWTVGEEKLQNLDTRAQNYHVFLFDYWSILIDLL